IPPAETSFFRYFPQIPAETEVLYHVMVGPNVLTFVKELGDFYGSGERPELFGFIDSIEAVDLNAPGLEFLDGTYFWAGMPRSASADEPEPAKFYRQAVGANGTAPPTTTRRTASPTAQFSAGWRRL